MKKIGIYLTFIFVLQNVSAQRKMDMSKISYVNNTYIVKKTGKPFSGKRIQYYPNGNVEIMSSTKNGKQNGRRITYWENGNIAVIAYENELYQNYGKLMCYNEDGKLNFSGFYNNGLLFKKGSDKPFTGKMISYYTNGQIAGENSFQNGKWNGTQVLYTRSGEIQSKCIFKDNEIVDCEISKKQHSQ